MVLCPSCDVYYSQVVVLVQKDEQHLPRKFFTPCALLHTGSWLEAERNTVKVFQESSPSVANITTSRLANVGLSMNPVEIPRGTGSAFVWDKEGHIVTNYHVVMDGNRARITLSDASTWDGEVVGVAKNKDLAVLKIKAPSAKLKPIAVGTSQVLSSRIGYQHDSLCKRACV